MALRSLFLAAALVGASLSGCSRETADHATSEVDSAAHERAIRSNISDWLEQIRKRDAAAIAGHYTEDGVLMPPGAPVSQGRSEIETAWRGMMETPGFDLTFEPTAIVVSSAGDMAIDRGTYRFTSTGPDGQVTDTGKYLVVWRNVDGTWKAMADMFNSDGQQPAT